MPRQAQKYLFSEEQKLSDLKSRVNDLKEEFKKHFEKLKQNTSFLRTSAPHSERVLVEFKDEPAYREELELQIRLAEETTTTLKQMMLDLNEFTEAKAGIAAIDALRGKSSDDDEDDEF